MHDVIVIGGGPAGLQAALTLGRMHHSVLLLDSGNYRNAPASHLHNFATHDGRPPSEFRAMARVAAAAPSGSDPNGDPMATVFDHDVWLPVRELPTEQAAAIARRNTIRNLEREANRIRERVGPGERLDQVLERLKPLYDAREDTQP